MHKTKRLVLLIEPDLLKEVKRAAVESAKNLSDYVRSSLLRSLNDRSALKRTSRLKGIAKFSMPLDELENSEDLKRQLEKNYRV